ncbi:MAG: stage III sporulation protein AE [Coprococcus sp.]
MTCALCHLAARVVWAAILCVTLLHPFKLNEDYINMQSEDIGTEDSGENELSQEEEFEELDMLIKEKMEVSYTDIYNAVKSGDMKSLGEYIGQILYNKLWYEIGESKGLFIQMLAVIMLGAVFTNLSGRISGYAGGNGFFVTYMILAALLLSCFTLTSQIAVDVISQITEFMMAFIPAYTMAAAYSNGQETAIFSRDIILLVVFLCENVLLKIVFPIIKCSGVCGLVNKMNMEDYFSRLVELFRSIAGWIMKTMFAAITGINVVKGIISPSLDRLGRNSAIKIISNIAGGAVVQTVAGVLVSSGMLIKNCIGIAGAIVVIVIAVIPAVKIFVVFMGLKVIAALVQPIGDKRFSEGVSSMAVTIELMFKASGIAILMFIISITAVIMLAR